MNMVVERARKAVKTRKLNAAKLRLSLRAKKAWKTRRANALKAMAV